MPNPSASTKPSRNATVGSSRSDLLDARQHLSAEQFERAQHRVSIPRARVLQRQIKHAGTDLLAAAPNLLDETIGTAAETDWQYAPDIRRPSFAPDIARIGGQQCVAHRG